MLNFNQHTASQLAVFLLFFFCLFVCFCFVGGCGLTKLLAYIQLSIFLETALRGALYRVLEVLHGIAHFPGVLSPIGSISLGYPQF